MKRHSSLLSLFILALSSWSTSAASLDKEIEYLYQYVAEATECVFVRNGKSYTTLEAVEHMQVKQGYFSKRIKSAEDFIKFSATKSTTSGKAYLIQCEGQEIVESADWLSSALMSYRLAQ
ncbi:DUF5329 family protein [Thaumasiovibrio subtropicus]|uniref:DUF5329 family protein n=1 Tax=Thaumasiovibrio subtropicus TaxID=1891207 RepID=UPI000B364801|nr:DUF5329 family protein [Thaumasiovibrio subtropicus]